MSGESCGHTLLLFIPVGVASSEAAYAEALRNAPGTDALVGYEARAHYFAILPLYRRFCTEAHGYAIKTADLAEPR